MPCIVISFYSGADYLFQTQPSMSVAELLTQAILLKYTQPGDEVKQGRMPKGSVKQAWKLHKVAEGAIGLYDAEGGSHSVRVPGIPNPIKITKAQLHSALGLTAPTWAANLKVFQDVRSRQCREVLAWLEDEDGTIADQTIWPAGFKAPYTKPKLQSLIAQRLIAPVVSETRATVV